MDKSIKLPEIEDVVIPEKVLEELERIPDSRVKHTVTLTPQQKAILLKYWKVKNKESLAKYLGFSTTFLRSIYRDMTDENERPVSA